jgi:hypothetical protein
MTDVRHHSATDDALWTTSCRIKIHLRLKDLHGSSRKSMGMLPFGILLASYIPGFGLQFDNYAEESLFHNVCVQFARDSEMIWACRTTCRDRREVNICLWFLTRVLPCASFTLAAEERANPLAECLRLPSGPTLHPKRSET